MTHVYKQKQSNCKGNHDYKPDLFLIFTRLLQNEKNQKSAIVTPPIIA